MRRLLLTTSFLVLGSSLVAAENCVTLDNKATAALFDEWNFTLSSLDPNQVVQRYWPNAVLLPTVSNTPRTNSAMIADYFEHFLAKRPRGRIDTRTIQSGCNLAIDMGTYTFSLMDDKGLTSEVAARYTFVYQYRDGAWKILHHHSSAMPERADAAPASHHAQDATSKPADAPAASARPVPRKERKARTKETAKHAEAAAPAAKPVAAAKAGEDAKPSADAKPAGDAKLAADAKPAADTQSPADEKAAATPTAEAKPTSDANSATEVKTAMFVNLTTSPPPSKFYPVESARKKERGNVNLKVCADGAGAITDRLEVLKSSGSKLLDEAAITWARAATWVPATLNHRRVEGCAQVDVAFEANPATAARART